jgi:hypothetical protein
MPSPGARYRPGRARRSEPGARPPGSFPGLTTRGSSRSRHPARTRRSTGLLTAVLMAGERHRWPAENVIAACGEAATAGTTASPPSPSTGCTQPGRQAAGGAATGARMEAAGRLTELCGYPRRHRRRPRTDRLRGRDPRWVLPECSLRPFNGSWTGRAACPASKRCAGGTGRPRLRDNARRHPRPRAR